MKKYLPIVAVAGALLIGIVGFLIVQNVFVRGLRGVKIPGANRVSSNILLLTQPVTNFSGKVDKVEGNAVRVSQQFTVTQPLAMMPPITTPGQPPPAFPTPLPPKTISYKVLINSTTQINRPPVYISYLLTTPTPPVQVKLSVKDLKPGQFININTNSDLRTLSGDEFTATSIQLPSIQNSINGKISSISGNTLLVKAFPPSQYGPAGAPALGNATIAPPKEVTYTVTITDATEISRYGTPEQPTQGTPPKPPTPEKLSLNDLKNDMQVTVYTDTDVTATPQFTALRIEPIIPPPTPIVSPLPDNPPKIPATSSGQTPARNALPETAAP